MLVTIGFGGLLSNIPGVEIATGDGLLHLQAARLVYMLGGTLDPGMVQGRIYQDAFNLLFFALFGIIVAVTLNWKNSRTGYWLNLIVVSAADIGFIVYVLAPGYVPIIPGALGPILWVLALAFSTLGFLKSAPDSTEA